MIEIMTDMPEDVVAFDAKGKVTGDDYEKILVPLVEEKLKKHDKIKLLYHLGPEFDSFEAEAMWDDAKVGLHHITSWAKIAMVSDVGWIKNMTKMFGFVMPAKVKVFGNDQLSEAIAWIKE